MKERIPRSLRKMRLFFSLLKSEKPEPHFSMIKTRIHPSDLRDLLYVFRSGVDPDVRLESACKLFVFRQLLSFFHFPFFSPAALIFQNELKFGQKKESFLNSGTTPGRILSHLHLYLPPQTHIPIAAKKNSPPEEKKFTLNDSYTPVSPEQAMPQPKYAKSLFAFPLSPSLPLNLH